MIYCTSGEGIPIESLGCYKEWTGEMPRVDFPQLNALLVIARDSEKNKIVGAAQWFVIDDSVWHRRWALVENVYVLKSYRQRDIGTQLMKFTEEQAFLFGCKFIKLTSRKEEGKVLYRSLGYEEGSSFRKELRDGMGNYNG